jgi:hypothetical protein
MLEKKNFIWTESQMDTDNPEDTINILVKMHNQIVDKLFAEINSVVNDKAEVVEYAAKLEAECDNYSVDISHLISES